MCLFEWHGYLVLYIILEEAYRRSNVLILPVFSIVVGSIWLHMGIKAIVGPVTRGTQVRWKFHVGAMEDGALGHNFCGLSADLLRTCSVDDLFVRSDNIYKKGTWINHYSPKYDFDLPSEERD